MSDKLNIEQLMQTRLEGTELTPSPASWKSIQRKLRRQLFLRFKAGRFNIYYAGALLLATAALVWALAGDQGKNEPIAPVDQTLPLMEPGRQDTQQSPDPLQESNRNTGKQESSSDGSSEKTEPDADTGRNSAYPKGDTAQGDGTDDPSLQKMQAVPLTSYQPEAEDQLEPLLVTYFTSSIQSGCAPLAVQFTDQSINATSYAWDFGTGETSSEQNPSYEFREPGRYMVSLTTQNHGSVATVSRMMIEVLAAPVADFQIEKGLEGIDNHVVLNLINYSSDGSVFAWNLVNEECEDCSKWSSLEHQPRLELKSISTDSRAVRLEVISENGCSDTAVQDLPLIVQSSETRIKFPTAFSPNPAGPGDGSFVPGSKRIDLFYPVYIEVPVEFHMRVYTRRGELVFESRDLYRGWDGYYNQEAANGDVYVWMAEGRWEDGEAFSMRGDLTLVWGTYW